MNKQAEELRKASDSEMSSLMEWNNLDYPEFEDAVVAKHRSLIKSDFNKTNYTAPTQTASVFLNFSDGYVDPDNSWLQFELVLAGDQIAADGTGKSAVSFGKGSALNLIKSVVMTSRSGQEICRQDKNNFYQYRKIKWTHSFTDYSRKLSGMANNQEDVSSATVDKVFCIPLKYLLGCFNPHDNVLLPNKLIAGARIDIEFEEQLVALCHETATALPVKTTYTIKDPAIFLDTVNLSDNVLDRLNKRSAMMGKNKGDMGGLPISWDTYDYVGGALSNITVGGQNSVHLSAKKALSKAKMAHVALCKSNFSGVQQAQVDNMNGYIGYWDEYQFRLGNDYYPKIAVKGGSATQKENFMNCQYSFSNLKGKPHDIPYGDFHTVGATVSTVAPSDVTHIQSYAVAACNLESGQIGNLGGKLLSNGRSLDFNGKAVPKGVGDTSLDVYYFVDYAVRCRVFPSKISITE